MVEQWVALSPYSSSVSASAVPELRLLCRFSPLSMTQDNVVNEVSEWITIFQAPKPIFRDMVDQWLTLQTLVMTSNHSITKLPWLGPWARPLPLCGSILSCLSSSLNSKSLGIKVSGKCKWNNGHWCLFSCLFFPLSHFTQLEYNLFGHVNEVSLKSTIFYNPKESHSTLQNTLSMPFSEEYGNVLILYHSGFLKKNK